MSCMKTGKQHNADDGGRRAMDASLSEDYEFPFEEELDIFQHLRSVRRRRGVREYIHDQSDVLFVTGHLSLCGCPEDLIFGRNTRSIFVAMHEQGLIPAIEDDPIENEIEVFGMREIRTKARPFSIVAVFSPPECIQGRRVTFGDWERI